MLLASAVSLLTLLRAPGWSVVAAVVVGVIVSVVLPLVMQRVSSSPGARARRRVFPKETELWSPISELFEPVRLGVHPALVVGEPEHSGTRTPPYVARDLDGELDEALGHERLVVVLGESTAGKSRFAFEALRRCVPDRWVLVPRSAGSLRRLVEAGCSVRDTVIWLDDLERYLTTGGLDTALLDTLVPPRSRVVVLATMRTRAYADFGPVKGPLAGEDPRPGQQLLDLAKILRLPRSPLSATEQARAVDVARRDPSLRAALAATATGVGLAEFLAAAPRLWERWQDGRDIEVQPVGAGIVSAAVDCRRAGLMSPIPAELLRELCPAYLNERGTAELTAKAFDEGLAWATTPVYATSALLTPVKAGYHVFDYLIDRLQSDPATKPVPDTLWDSLVTHLPPDDACQVGIAAFHARRYAVAHSAFVKADGPGVASRPLAVHGLGLLSWQDGRLDEAADLLRRALDLVEADDPSHAVVSDSLGHLLRDQGALDEARAVLQQAADLGYLPAVISLGHLLLDAGEQDAAEREFRKAMLAGSTHAAIALGALREDRSEPAGAEEAFRVAMGRGSLDATVRLGKLLRRNGDAVGAGRYLEAAATAGHLDAANELGMMLIESGDEKTGTSWLQRAADSGDAAAAHNLAVRMTQLDKPDEAERHMRQSALSGGYVAAINLANLLADRGDLLEAMTWCHRVVDAPADELAAHEAELNDDLDLRAMAMTNLGHISARAGQLALAHKWFEDAAATGYPGAVTALAEYRRLREELYAEARRTSQEADSDDPDAILKHGALLATLGELEQEQQVLQPLAESGHEPAILALAANAFNRGEAGTALELVRKLDGAPGPEVAENAAMLAAQLGDADAAKKILAGTDLAVTADGCQRVAEILLSGDETLDVSWFTDRAAGGGHAAAMNDSAIRRLKRGEDAEPLFREAAIAGNTNAAYNLAGLLKARGEFAEAEHWYRLAIDKGHRDALNNFGTMLMDLGRYAEAKMYLRRLATSGDHDAEVNLGYLFIALGREHEARMWLRRASEGGHPHASALLDQLTTES
ncbi:SEL1-like repeat protein [Actinophytocola sp.]|uniref:SEL1-like repeat protein n=1 Tax=Actinophytocola sp. TaxID=1872138 RepID=UPI003D6B5721